MPSKTELFSSIFKEVAKGFVNQGGGQQQPYGSNTGSASMSGYNPQQPYDQNQGYPQPSGSPSQYGGYPGQPGGYPQQQGGYPGPTDGYPSQQSGYPRPTGGYPGYPGQQQGAYPGSTGGYPGPGGYPGQQNLGYPPGPQGSGGYPGMTSGYSGQTGGYPNQGSVGPQGQSSYPGYRGPTSGGPSSALPAPGVRPFQPTAPRSSTSTGGYPVISPSGFGSRPSAQSNIGHQSSYSTVGPPAMDVPSIRPFPNFNANADAETLRKAMKGFGCNKTKVIEVLCARSNDQRQQIALAFKTMYGKDLCSDLKSELSGDFEDLILALMERPAKYDAMQLRKAMAGLGTTESILIEIMSSRSNEQIHQIRQAYRELYNRDLEKDLVSETSGHFKRLLVSLCAGGRDESMQTNPLKANQDARALAQAGEKRLGTDESCFNAIMASQNYAQLRLVFQEYQKVMNHPIEQAIVAEFSGDIKDGLLAVIACAQNRPAYFATLLYNSMAGLGTRDNDLIRLVVSRSEIDLATIRQEFEKIYKKPLVEFIKGDCSGAYKDGLIALTKGN
ncbi:hypothetical protein AB6A40_005182 [Gnathostoma spinigerum]|uniref:Annexin n=1 Tax=Gnathostoma spinigerum TaxID=75299 RepID=A0ABD6EEQ1_9BILA